MNRVRSVIIMCCVWSVFWFGTGVGLQRCATPTPPRGGDRDSIGPKLVMDKSTPNAQVNLRPEEIVLTFDEWVQLKNPSQIVISPPINLTDPPRLKGRSLIIPLAGVALKDSVTYTVSLGESIVDLNEGNPTDNMRFVFSTGPKLDSARLSGQVVDAYTGEGLDGVLVSLYDNLADTAVTSQRPFYFANTDENGYYDMNFLRRGEYAIYALQNANGVYEYGSATSGVGFLDSTIWISDTINELPAIRLSPLPRAVQYQIDSSEYGQLRIGFDRPARQVTVSGGRADYIRVWDGDTLRLYYEQAGADSLFIGDPDLGLDTVYVASLDWRRPAEVPLLGLLDKSAKPLAGRPLELTFNWPLEAVDVTQVVLLKDSSELAERLRLDIVEDRPRVLRVGGSWTAGERYSLRLAPNALLGQGSARLADTLVVDIQAAELSTVGRIDLKVSGLDSTQAYILQLVDSASDLVVKSMYVDEASVFEIRIADLPAASYRLEAIEDRNRNGRYDGARLEPRRLPEPVQILDIEALRANWEVSAELKFDF